MAEYQRAVSRKQGDLDQKHRTRQPESQTSINKSHALDEGKRSLTETPFAPHLEEHAAILSRTASPEQNHEYLMRLHKAYGNRYVQRLLKSIKVQAKFTVSDPDDAYEQEADRVAEKVVRSVNRQVQRQADEEEEPLQGKLQRQADEEEEPLQGKLQRQKVEMQTKSLAKRAAMNTVPEVTSDLEDKINAGRSGGRPIDKGMLLPMQHTFGADFSKVRIHTDANADTLNKSLQAKAFTTGKDIFFKNGEYNTESSGGQLLLAHELTHTIQQGSSTLNSPIRRNGSSEGAVKDSKTGFEQKRKYFEELSSGKGKNKTGPTAEEKIEKPYKAKPLEGMNRTVYEQALATFKKMGKSRIRGGMSSSGRRIEAVKYLDEKVESSKKYPAYYSQQIINSILDAYQAVFGEELEQGKAPEKQETQKGTQAKIIPLAEPDQSPGPETYLSLVQNAKFIKASGGGTGGVFFLYQGTPVEGKKVNPDVVVKFEPGEAVRGKFAENLLLAGGFDVTRSLVYAANSSKGKKVKSKIQSLANSPGSFPQDDSGKGRLEQVFGKIDQGNAVIVSDFIPSLGTVADVMAPQEGGVVKNTPETEKALVEAFNNVENGVNLGKLMVFDAMLGNQDRLEAMNLANVMLAKRGGKWTFVLIDNDAEVPTMMGSLEPKLKMQAEMSGMGRPTYESKGKLTVKQWVKNLIEGGQGETKKIAKINFIDNAGKSAAKTVEELKSKYLSAKGMENVLKAINLGLLQRAIGHGINEGANAILNINTKTLKKMLEKETKSLGKTQYLGAFAMELKWHYVQMVFEQKKKHEEAMAEIEAMASKKMKDLTGSADYVFDEQTGYQQQGKIKTK